MLQFSEEKGFTFLESIIAMLIVTIGIVAIIQALAFGFGEEASNRRETQGIFLCQGKIEEINSESYKDILVSSQTENSLPSPFEEFARTTTINYVDANLDATTTDTGLKKIEVQVSWPSFLKLRNKEIKIITLIAEK